MSLLVLGLNHRSAPVELREKLAVEGAQLSSALESLAKRVAPGVILSTCNRLEIYTLAEDSTDSQDPLDGIRKFVSEYSCVPLAELEPFFYHYQEEDCVRHLFRVASGLDSMVVGEWEILGQVRAAFSAASSPETGSRAGAGYVRGPIVQALPPGAAGRQAGPSSGQPRLSFRRLPPALRQPRRRTTGTPAAGRPVPKAGAPGRGR